MGRIVQREGTKGSLKWIQHVINKSPSLLNNTINDFIGSKEENTIEWLSPKEDDDYSEYRDQGFLDLLGINLSKNKLRDFWPPQGPQWDALGRIKDSAYFLVEAKAHVSELISSSQAKSTRSKSLIKKSLDETRAYLNLNRDFDFTKGLYQYCNRLAHLYFLRTVNNIPAYLVFVYFIYDNTHIPTRKDEWRGALQLMHSLLDSNSHKLARYIIDVFIDLRDMQ